MTSLFHRDLCGGEWSFPVLSAGLRCSGNGSKGTARRCAGNVTFTRRSSTRTTARRSGREEAHAGDPRSRGGKGGSCGPDSAASSSLLPTRSRLTTRGLKPLRFPRVGRTPASAAYDPAVVLRLAALRQRLHESPYVGQTVSQERCRSEAPRPMDIPKRFSPHAVGQQYARRTKGTGKIIPVPFTAGYRSAMSSCPLFDCDCCAPVAFRRGASDSGSERLASRSQRPAATIAIPAAPRRTQRVVPDCPAFSGAFSGTGGRRRVRRSSAGTQRVRNAYISDAQIGQVFSS